MGMIGRMRYYVGRRLGGVAEVLVGPGPDWYSTLDPRCDLRNHSPTGFQWGYGGSGPAQLALAILADHFKHHPAEALEAMKGADIEDGRKLSEQAALRWYQDFKFKVIGALGDDSWTLDSAGVRKALGELGAVFAIREAAEEA